jgi:hypothetical protein
LAVYILSVNRFLTKQEQTVLLMLLLILVTGWAVKTWRLAHPKDQLAKQIEPAAK